MINEWEGIGRLGKDPEIRFDKKGGAIVNFNMVTNHTFKNKDNEKIDKPSWHKIVGFGNVAKICGDYLHKGSLVRIVARVDYHKWTDKNDIERWTTEMIITDMKMLDRKGDHTEQDSTTPVYSSSVPYNRPSDDVPF